MSIYTPRKGNKHGKRPREQMLYREGVSGYVDI